MASGWRVTLATSGSAGSSVGALPMPGLSGPPPHSVGSASVEADGSGSRFCAIAGPTDGIPCLRFRAWHVFPFSGRSQSGAAAAPLCERPLNLVVHLVDDRLQMLRV